MVLHNQRNCFNLRCWHRCIWIVLQISLYSCCLKSIMMLNAEWDNGITCFSRFISFYVWSDRSKQTASIQAHFWWLNTIKHTEMFFSYAIWTLIWQAQVVIAVHVFVRFDLSTLKIIRNNWNKKKVPLLLSSLANQGTFVVTIDFTQRTSEKRTKPTIRLVASLSVEIAKITWFLSVNPYFCDFEKQKSREKKIYTQISNPFGYIKVEWFMQYVPRDSGRAHKFCRISFYLGFICCLFRSHYQQWHGHV